MLRKALKKTKIDPSEKIFEDINRYFFIFILLAVLGLFFWTISPFFSSIVYAALIAVVLQPMQSILVKLLRGHRGLAAFLSTLIALLIVVIPLTLFSIYLVQEAIQAVYSIQKFVVSTDFSQWIYADGLVDLPYGGQLLDWLQNLGIPGALSSLEIYLFDALQRIAENLATVLVNQSGKIVTGLLPAVVSFGVFILTLFFLLRDGQQLRHYLKQVSPLPKEYEDLIEGKMGTAMYGIVIGNIGTALIQGLVAGVGFVIAGVQGFLLWISILCFASLIPYIGSTVIWFPVSIALIAHGGWEGWFLLIWGGALVSNVDNIVRPFLIGGSTHMNTLATFLSLMGGIFVMGVKGIVFGPLILSLAVTLLEIYQLEYKKVL